MVVENIDAVPDIGRANVPLFFLAGFLDWEKLGPDRFLQGVVGIVNTTSRTEEQSFESFVDDLCWRIMGTCVDCETETW